MTVLKQCIIVKDNSRWNKITTFKISKTYQYGGLKRPWRFVFQKHIKRSTLKFHPSKILQKSMSKWLRSFAHQDYINKACRNDMKIRRCLPVDVDLTWWACWFNIRTKLVLVSTQNHRCFSIKFWACFSVYKMLQRWNADPFNVNVNIITSWAS